SEKWERRLRRDLRNGSGDYGENGCTGETKKRRTNGEDRKIERLIEDELSSPFDLRYSVSPVSPCPPHPPFPGRVLRIIRSLAVSSASSVPYLVTARGCCPADMVPTTDARWAAKIVASAWTLSDASP